MNRIELMQLVRAYQVEDISRRQFMKRATLAVGAAAAAALLAACGISPDNPPPVIDETQSPAEPGTTSTGAATTGIVTYPGPSDSELMGYVSYLDSDAARPAVIVIQEWWGLNDHIKDIADRYAAEGFVALAPDLYQGVATTEPDEARKLAMELGSRDAVSEIVAAVDYLQSTDVAITKVGITGYCMGGGLVYQSLSGSNRFDAGVAFYGSPIRPNAAGNVNAALMTHLGTADGISANAVQAVHDVLTENSVANEFHLYEGAPTLSLTIRVPATVKTRQRQHGSEPWPGLANTSRDRSEPQL